MYSEGETMAIELKAQGDVFAADGWRMAWDTGTAPGQTRCGPGRIDTWNEVGTPGSYSDGT